MALGRFSFDCLSALALALTALAGAYTPVYLAARDRLGPNGGTPGGRSLTYVLGNMLSAGVMVSAGFCHLLGEALKQLPVVGGAVQQFPTAPFLCGLGYMMTLMADKLASSAASGSRLGDKAGGPAKDPAGCCAVEVLAGMDLAERGSGSGAERYHKDSSEQEGLLLAAQQPHASPPPPKAPRLDAREGPAAAGALANGGSGWGGAAHHRAPHVHGSEGGSGGTSLELEGPRGSSSGGGGIAAEQQQHWRGEPPQQQQQQQQPGGGAGSRHVSFLTAVLMGVALCFHSLLEGAAMGAQQTLSNTMHIFIAIVSHKGLAAYALGSSIVDSSVSMQCFWSVVLPFTFASPVGIFVGYIISDVAQGTGAAAISALASGTFLYVAFMEVIPKELRDPSHMALKLFMLMLGFSLMSILAIWA